MAIRKDVATEKSRAFGPHLVRTQGDSVVEEDSARAEQLPSVLKVKREPDFAYVLDHAYAHQLVETADFVQVAVVVQFHPAAVLQAGLRNPLIGYIGLVFGWGGGQDNHTRRAGVGG